VSGDGNRPDGDPKRLTIEIGESDPVSGVL